MTKQELRSLIKEEIKKVLNENAPTVYGEKEAIKMIWDDPGNKIENALKKMNKYGYESTVRGKTGKELYIYFTSHASAKKGAIILSQLVPGPEYEKMIKSEDYGGVGTEWYIEIKA